MTNDSDFGRLVGFYDQTRGFTSEDTNAIAALMVCAANLKPTSRFLEVGIGTGRLMIPLLSHVNTIYGIDISLLLLLGLRGKPASQALRVAQADARQLPFPAASIDTVLTAHVFNLLPDWPRAGAEIARVLPPDGVLLNAWHRDFHKPSWWDVWTKAMPHGRRDLGLPHEQQHEALVALGWQPFDAPHEHVIVRRMTPRHFLDQLAGRVWSSTWALSEAQLVAAIAAVREAMLAEHGTLDVEITFDSRFAIYAYHPPSNAS